ncbi:MAG: 3-oxoacyl-[acyl-carrier-protein] reductase [Proteobacteria bacterium]|nr:3-oxoacyl-[acyl-carrier-protein] reductase [Pseudomonadota bacterium]
MFKFQEKTALVTGASGGIGRAIASMLIQQKCGVVLSGTKEDVLESLKKEFLELDPLARVFVLPTNLKNAESVDKLFEEAEKLAGPIDILVNNAGITKDNLLMRMKDEEWHDVIDINLTSCFRLCRAAVKSMMKRKKGRIINISSVVATMGNAGQTNYCASKAGMIGFSKALAKEVASRNITVNCIAPGFIATNMTEVLNDTIKTQIAAQIPMNKMGQGEDIAAAVVFLASDEASYITGQTLHVNGGMDMI